MADRSSKPLTMDIIISQREQHAAQRAQHAACLAEEFSEDFFPRDGASYVLPSIVQILTRVGEEELDVKQRREIDELITNCTERCFSEPENRAKLIKALRPLAEVILTDAFDQVRTIAAGANK